MGRSSRWRLHRAPAGFSPAASNLWPNLGQAVKRRSTPTALTSANRHPIRPTRPVSGGAAAAEKEIVTRMRHHCTSAQQLHAQHCRRRRPTHAGVHPPTVRKFAAARARLDDLIAKTAALTPAIRSSEHEVTAAGVYNTYFDRRSRSRETVTITQAVGRSPAVRGTWNGHNSRPHPVPRRWLPLTSGYIGLDPSSHGGLPSRRTVSQGRARKLAHGPVQMRIVGQPAGSGGKPHGRS